MPIPPRILSKKIKIRPTTYRAACDFIKKIHRHHGIPQGHKFSICCMYGEDLVGVATVGRPVSRHIDKGIISIEGCDLKGIYTIEVTRLCVDDKHPAAFNCCSKLYAAARKISKEMGYDLIITYILDTENGFSLRGAGWHRDKGHFGGKSWSVPSRPRVDKSPQQFKFRYYSKLSAAFISKPLPTPMQ